jgi:TonB family protein
MRKRGAEMAQAVKTSDLVLVAVVALGLALSSCASNSGKDPLPAVAEPSSPADSPVSFESRDYDWGNYAALLAGHLEANWKVPAAAKMGWKGRVDVRFTILRNGSIEDLVVLRSSTVDSYDHAVTDAIRRASPFAPLPGDFPRDRERVTISFFYNIRPSQGTPTAIPTPRPS